MGFPISLTIFFKKMRFSSYIQTLFSGFHNLTPSFL